jgi:hypothetical protein
VCLVVARGASNKEAAAELFLRPKTIEVHLGHIYAKLGVRSRTELAALVAREGLRAPFDRQSSYHGPSNSVSGSPPPQEWN